MEVEFHDTGRGVRVPSMTDYFGFNKAAMNEMGSVFASPRKGEKSPSTILYRPFSSWASNSEWSMRLPSEEEATAVAVGFSWVAASTSLNYLRVFSEGGLQTSVLSLEGPVVTMAGHQELLAVVTHAGSPFSCGQQVINFIVFNVSERTKVMEGRLPLSPGSHLAWLGFSDTGFLSSYDSKGLLRVHSNQYGGCWIPVFSASKEVKSEDESIWMVGLNSTQAMCVVCKIPDKQPQVSPKPILSIFNLCLPLVHSDLGADDLENEYLLGSWRLTQLTDEAACMGDEDDQEEEILKLEANLDRCILRLIAAACKGDKLAKAVELTKKLTLGKSWKGAIKLVSAMRLPALAERLSAMYEEKMVQESSQYERQLMQNTNRLGQVHQDAPDKSLNTQDLKPSTAVASFKTALLGRLDDPASDDHALPNKHPSLAIKKESDTWIERKEMNEARTSPAIVHVDQGGMDAGETTPSSAVQEAPVPRPNNPFAKSSSNPFAKSSPGTNSQSGVSLLQSLKRIRDTDLDSNGLATIKPTKSGKTS